MQSHPQKEQSWLHKVADKADDALPPYGHMLASTVSGIGFGLLFGVWGGVIAGVIGFALGVAADRERNVRRIRRE